MSRYLLVSDTQKWGEHVVFSSAYWWYYRCSLTLLNSVHVLVSPVFPLYALVRVLRIQWSTGVLVVLQVFNRCSNRVLLPVLTWCVLGIY